MDRRQFVGGALAGVAALAPPAHGAAIRAGDVPRRVFGKTGEKLTLIGQAGGRLSFCDFDQATAVTRRAYDLGLNYFDNAHSYWDGRSEEVYGAALHDVRKEVFLTSKTTARTRKGAEAELQLSLKRLKTDYLDLWQIHAVGEMEDVDQIFAPGGAIEAFEAAKKAGTCRFIGFTGHRDPHVHLEMLRRYDGYDTILMPLNAADPSYLELRDTRAAGSGQAGPRHPGDEEPGECQADAAHERRPVPPVRPQPADPLPGGRLHDAGADRGRRSDRDGLSAVQRGGDGRPAQGRRGAGRTAAGGLEARPGDCGALASGVRVPRRVAARPPRDRAGEHLERHARPRSRAAPQVIWATVLNATCRLSDGGIGSLWRCLARAAGRETSDRMQDSVGVK